MAAVSLVGHLGTTSVSSSRADAQKPPNPLWAASARSAASRTPKLVSVATALDGDGLLNGDGRSEGLPQEVVVHGADAAEVAAEADLAALSAALRSSGYRVTPQRQLVLEAVVELGHGTPDTIAAAVAAKVPGISLSTVYRTLEVLEDIGAVRHAHLGHGAPTYHPADAPHHLHLVCRSCDWVGEVPVETAGPLTSQLQDERGFVTDLAHFALYGTCAACAAAASSDPS